MLRLEDLQVRRGRIVRKDRIAPRYSDACVVFGNLTKDEQSALKKSLC